MSKSVLALAVLMLCNLTTAALLMLGAGPACLGKDEEQPSTVSTPEPVEPTVSDVGPANPRNARYNALLWNAHNASAGKGKVDRSPWFEWWYTKVVLPESGKSFYFVYGIVNPWDQEQAEPGSRSYVGFGNFSEGITTQQVFPVGSFSAAYDRTEVDIAGNHMTDKHLQGSITDESGAQHTWDVSIEFAWEFNAMGWGLYLPNATNIGWYPAQASARCSGTITSAGETISFQDQPCYQDRNWGKEFPTWWAWIVSNHFEGHPDTALVIGGGKPEILGVEILEGVCIGLKHEGKVYTFRPNHLNPVFVDISFGKWQMTAYSGTYKIEVSADAPEEAFLDLQFQTPQGEIFHDLETLTGHVTVQLSQLGASLRWQSIATLESKFAGIEYGSH